MLTDGNNHASAQTSVDSLLDTLIYGGHRQLLPCPVLFRVLLELLGATEYDR